MRGPAFLTLVCPVRRRHIMAFALVNVLPPFECVVSIICRFLPSPLPVLFIRHSHFKQDLQSSALRVVQEKFSNSDMPSENAKKKKTKICKNIMGWTNPVQYVRSQHLKTVVAHECASVKNCDNIHSFIQP